MTTTQTLAMTVRPLVSLDLGDHGPTPEGFETAGRIGERLGWALALGRLACSDADRAYVDAELSAVSAEIADAGLTVDVVKHYAFRTMRKIGART